MGVIQYRKYKSLGLCPKCGKIETEGKICDPCKEKHRLYQENWILNMSEEQYKDRREQERFNFKHRYNRLKEEGICTMCGKVKVKDKKYVNCSICRRRKAQIMKTKYHKKKREGESICQNAKIVEKQTY